MACNTTPTEQTTTIEPYQDNNVIDEAGSDPNDYWARENFDLQRVGTLLERSDDPGEFETYLNSDDGYNNLDLNGDGYVDYISVAEFNDRDDNERGMTLFSRFGPDLIQEIATIVFRRDSPNYPGANILLRGNDQIYGDDHYYETNWQDRSLGIVSALFSDRDTYYQSPYYNGYYPDYYEAYPVVATPVYRTRVQQLYPEPVFIQASQPSIARVKIKSPYKDKYMDKIYAKLAKPTKEQKEFKKNNPNRPQFVSHDQGKRGNDRSDAQREPRGNPRFERENNRGGRDKDEAPGTGNRGKGKDDAERGNSGKSNRGGKNNPSDRGEGKQSNPGKAKQKGGSGKSKQGDKGNGKKD